MPAARLFESAQQEIDVLAYSGLFLAEDAKLLGVFASRARAGVIVRIALGDPDSPYVAERGTEEGIDQAMAARIRNALALYQPLLELENVDIRLHRTTLYNSIYRADRDPLAKQHVYGVPATNSPVFHIRRANSSDMFSSYLDSFMRIWASANQAG